MKSYDKVLSSSTQTCEKELAVSLHDAAKNENITIDKYAIAIGIAPIGTLVSAAVSGLATIDMIRYEKGILTNFIYIDSKETTLVSGFYAITTIAEFVKVGRIAIRAEFTQQGKLIAATHGFAEISSLRVPPDAPHSVQIGVGILQTPTQPNNNANVPKFTTYTRCSNGGWTCISMPCPGGC